MPVNKFDKEKVSNKLADFVVSKGKIEHRIMINIGIYEVNEKGLDVSVIFDRAHLALSMAGNEFQSGIIYYDDKMREMMLWEQLISTQLPKAIEEKQIVPYLQPLVDSAGKVVGAEALVRWEHPEHGFLSPGKFIPIFENNGFIVRLDRFVWDEACKVLRAQIDAGLKPVPISVNLSRLNFYSQDLLEYLQGLMKKYDLPTNLLKLEITESAYMDNPHQLIAMVRAFKGHGFSVLMDDFGSGYSSLSMLKDLPVDVLKIDMAFVQEVDKSSRAGAILESIVELGKHLRMEVVVEGVETKEQVDFLEKIGCRVIQGYYFSKPIDVGSFMGLVKRSQGF